MRMRRLYDPEKIRQGIAMGKTAINSLGDPLPKMGMIHVWLGELYDQVCKQTITARVPAHRNLGQQENEIIQHFTKIWDNKQYDINRLPASVDDPDNLFTPDEPYVSGTVVLHQPEAEEMDDLEEDSPEEVTTLMQDSDAYSESEDNPDDSAKTTQESTDAEIREAMASMMISNDQDYRKLVGLSLEQSTAAANAMRKTVEKVQTDNFVPDMEGELMYFHSQRSESTWHMVKFKEDEPSCQRDETPERGSIRPKDRGRSTAKCQTATSRGTLERSLVAGYSALVQRPGSLKRERMPAPQPSGSTPTQSPVQKNTKLKSIVFKPKQQDAHPTSSWQPDGPTIPLHGG